METEMQSGERLFFELLQVAVGSRDGLSLTPNEEQWDMLLDLSKRQALMGVAFAAIDMLPQEQWPPRTMRLQWGMLTQKYVRRNEELAAMCKEIAARFAQCGFWCCVLKGQGNMMNYPERLYDRRAPGDIDVWVAPTPKRMAANPKRPIRTVVDFCQSVQPAEKVGYIHLDFPVWGDAEIEVHIRPSFLCSPLHNWRLQRWFRRQAGRQRSDSRDFPIPTNGFNAVYQLLHIYKHLFEEGIGLRQLLDYYFVLKNTTSEERKEAIAVLRTIAADKFAAAVMYVLREVFDNSEGSASWMLCLPDEKRGRHLLGEVLTAGNFGEYDARNGDMEHEGHAGRYWRKTKRACRLLALYPHEALWQPWFMVYHMAWRVLKLWRFE